MPSANVVGAGEVQSDAFARFRGRRFIETRGRPDPAQGVFETLAVRDGRPQALRRHLERLAVAVRDLYGARLPRDLETRARLMARRLEGTHRLRILARPAAGGLRVLIESRPFCPPALQRAIVLSPVLLPGGLGPYKWSDRRLLDGLSSQGSTPLIVDHDGSVLEAAWANIWLLEGERIVTPGADGRLLSGVTRSLLLERAPALGLTTSTEPISVTRARKAEAVFLTSSLRYAVMAAIDGGTSPHRDNPFVKIIRSALRCAGWDR